jgi:hypothetical protein
VGASRASHGERAQRCDEDDAAHGRAPAARSLSAERRPHLPLSGPAFASPLRCASIFVAVKASPVS